MSKRKVAYYYDCGSFKYSLQSYLNPRTADVGAYTYGLGHPMKPHRIRVTHDLVTAYDMLDKMHVLVGVINEIYYETLTGFLAAQTRISRDHEFFPYRRIRRLFATSNSGNCNDDDCKRNTVWVRLGCRYFSIGFNAVNSFGGRGQSGFWRGFRVLFHISGRIDLWA